MQKQRVSFGACFLDAAHSEVMVAGGFGYGQRSLPDTEVYSVKDNKWRITAPLNVPRKGANLLRFRDGAVYCFGGNSGEASVDSIERIDIGAGETAWTPLGVKLHKPVENMGCALISPKEILIFGGWSNGQKFKEGRILFVENEK